MLLSSENLSYPAGSVITAFSGNWYDYCLKFIRILNTPSACGGVIELHGRGERNPEALVVQDSVNH